MARTGDQLTPEEVIAVEELNNVPNNSMIFKDNTGNYQDISLGVAGTVPTSNGTTSAPTFQVNAGGDVTGPGSSTDNAIPRYDGITGKLLQDSGVLIDDSDNVTIPGTLTVPGDGVITDATSISNTKIGNRAGANIVSGVSNSAFGEDALNANTIGSNNTAIGRDALLLNEASNNTAIGSLCLDANVGGLRNTAVGTSALGANVSGNECTAVGQRALLNSTGDQNTAIGKSAGDAITTGINNVIIGFDSDTGAVDSDNAIVIGTSTTGLGSNTVVLGNDNIVTTVLKGDVGIGIETPLSQLHIVREDSIDTNAIFQRNVTAATGASVEFRKSRGTEATPLIVSDGDTIGGFSSQAHDGTAFVNGPFIQYKVDGTPGVGDMPSRMEFKVVTDGGTSRLTAMVIKNDGFIGIGTETPEERLHTSTEGASNTFIGDTFSDTTNRRNGFNLRRARGTQASPTIVSAGDHLFQFASQAFDGAAYQSTSTIRAVVDTATGVGDISGYLAFSTRPDGVGAVVEGMRLDKDGQLGIGTDTPDVKLHSKSALVAIKGERTSTSGTGSPTTLGLKATSSINMIEGFGSKMEFLIEDDTSGELVIAQIRGMRGTVDTKGKLDFRVGTFGVETVMTLTEDLRVGIGIDAPISLLHVQSANNPVIFEKTTTSGTTQATVLDLKTTTSVDATGEIGPRINFRFEDDTSGSLILAKIIGFRDGSDTEGGLKFLAGTSGNDAIMTLKSTGRVGIGTTSPTSPIHVLEDTTGVGINTGLTIEQAGIGDAIMQYLLTGARRWVTGIDNSDGNKFKISSGADLNTDAHFTIDVVGNIGIEQTNPLAKLHVDQSSTTGAIPVLYLDQADISEEMIEFNTTIGTGNAIEAVGAKVLTTTHFIKVTIPGGLTRYIPIGTIA